MLRRHRAELCWAQRPWAECQQLLRFPIWPAIYPPKRTALADTRLRNINYRGSNIKKNWLVTGSSKGLGRAIVEQALAEGNNVVATARETSGLTELAGLYPTSLSTVRLDVTDEGAVVSSVKTALSQLGRLDVLINNADYASIAPFEQIEGDSFRRQIETNLFGVVNLTRAVLPYMRVQGSGHIINISSVGGRVGAPGLSAYQAAKWAVSGFTEVVSQEIAPFGVRMISVEPGGMRTDWGATAKSEPIDLIGEYESSVGVFLEHMIDFVGNEIGDPVKVAKVVFVLSRNDDLPAHLLLGTDALQAYAAGDDLRQKAAADWIEVSRSTDFDNGEITYLRDVGLQ